MYKVNDVIVHESGVVCRITDIGKPDFISGTETYYMMEPVCAGGGIIYVKINNDKVYMRRVMSRNEAEQCLRELPEMDAAYNSNSKEREKKSVQVLKSCQFEDYFVLLKSLMLERRRKEGKGEKLNTGDERNLRKAEKMLSAELSAIFQITLEQAAGVLKNAVCGCFE